MRCRSKTKRLIDKIKLWEWYDEIQPKSYVSLRHEHQIREELKWYHANQDRYVQENRVQFNLNGPNSWPPICEAGTSKECRVIRRENYVRPEYIIKMLNCWHVSLDWCSFRVRIESKAVARVDLRGAFGWGTWNCSMNESIDRLFRPLIGVIGLLSCTSLCDNWSCALVSHEHHIINNVLIADCLISVLAYYISSLKHSGIEQNARLESIG